MKNNERFICLDIGTTTIRCLIIESDSKILGSAFRKVEISGYNFCCWLFIFKVQLVYPGEGRVEIDPKFLWENVVAVVNSALYGKEFFIVVKWATYDFVLSLRLSQYF